MKRLLLLAALLAASTIAQEAPPATPPAATPPVTAPVTPPPLAAPGAIALDYNQSAFVIAPLRFEGGVDVISAAQRADITRIVAEELPRALARRFPTARVAAPTDTAPLTLTPVIVAPASLTPFSSLDLRFEVSVPGESGPRMYAERFGLMQLWLAQGNAHVVALDGTFKKLP